MLIGFLGLIHVQMNRTYKTRLNVYRQIVNAFGSFHHGFGDRRVRVHRAAQFVGGRFELHGHACFGDQLGRMWTNDVYAQNFVVLLFADDFYETFFLTDDASLA